MFLLIQIKTNSRNKMAHSNSIELIFDNENLLDPVVQLCLEKININTYCLINKKRNYDYELNKIKNYYNNYPLLFEEIFNYILAKNNNFIDVSKIKFMALKKSNTYRICLSVNINFGIFYKDLVHAIIKYLDIPTFLAIASTCKKMFCFMMNDDVIKNIKTEYLQKKMLLPYFSEKVYDNIYDNVSNAKEKKMMKELKIKKRLTETKYYRNDTDYIFQLSIQTENFELLKKIDKQKSVAKLDYKFGIDYSSYVGNKHILKFLLDRTNSDITDALLYGCYMGNYDVCRLLLDNKRKNYSVSTYRNAIFITEWTGNYKLFKLFLSKQLGYFIMLDNDKKKHHLFNSIKGGNIDIVKFWIEQGTDINERIYTTNFGGCTTLHMAVYYSRYEILKYFIKRGGNVYTNCTYKSELMNLLSLACNPKNKYNPNIINIVHLLLEHCTEIEHSAIENCCKNGFFDILKLICKKSENIIHNSRSFLLEQLCTTINNGYIDIFNYLLGILQPTYEDFKNIIDTIITKNQPEIIKYILQFKWITNSEKEKFIEDIFRKASLRKIILDVDVIKCVHQYSIDNYSRNYRQYFRNALTDGQSKIVKYLIENNINNIKLNNDYSLYYAVMGGNIDIIEIFLKYGTDINVLYDNELWRFMNGHYKSKFCNRIINLLEMYGFSKEKYEEIYNSQ